MKKITYIILVLFFILNKSQAINLTPTAILDTTGIKNDSIKTYTTKEILIHDKTKFFDKISSGFIKKITSTEQITSTSIGNLLASKPGIFTKSYGSEGSLQTISIRGSGSEYTSVFINGINYNNSLNGVFDFSKFSADEMNEIIIKKGNDFEPLNSNSFGSVIELNPFEKSDTSNSVIKLQTGSFGYQGLQLKSTGLILNTYYKIHFSHKSAKNNYEYTFNNETGVRKNSDINQNTLNLAFVNSFEIFNQPVRINSFLNLLDKKLGLPNFVSSNRHTDSGTREQEKSLSYSLNSKVFFSDWIYINGIFGVNQNHLNINDPLLTINLRTKYFKLKDNSISSKFFVNLVSGKLFLTSGLSGIYENFDKNEFKENQTSSSENFYRKTFNANFKFSFEEILLRELILNSSFFVSYNSISNYYQSMLKRYKFPNIRIGLSIKSNQYNILTFANAGTGIRIPNFYEYSFAKLTSLSNKELEPEKILNYEVGMRLEKKELLIELIYFTFDVQNKIIWIPQRVAFFSPINSGRIKSSGIEFNLENLKLNKNFSVEINYTLTNALKKSRLGETDNSYNKQIPYIPKHKASISLNFTSKLFEIIFNSNYYGRRFITEDNDELFSLDPVIISNLLTTHQLSINKLKFSFQLSIQNIFNISYQLIQSFPMPGREYRLTIQMEV